MHLYRAWYLVCGLIFLKLPFTNEEVHVEEKIEGVINDLHQLLNQTDPIMVDDIDLIFDQINNILQEDVVFPGELLQLINELGVRVDLNGSYAETTVRDNIALLMADTTNPILGIGVARRDTEAFTEDAVRILDVTEPIDVLFVNVSEMVILIPASMRNPPHRISFVVFRDSRAFSNEYDPHTVNSLVASVNALNYTGQQGVINYMAPTADHMDSMNHACVYWQFLDDGTGYWSEEGCVLLPSVLDPQQLDSCHCNKLAYLTRTLVPEVTTTTTSPRTRSPQTEILVKMSDIQLLLFYPTDPVMDDVIPIISRINDLLYLEQDEVDFPARLWTLLDQLNERVNLNGSNTATVIRDNIALLTADSTPENPVLGMSLASRDSDTFEEDSFNFLSNVDLSLLDVNVNEIVVFLPMSIARDPNRISFMVFRDARAFTDNNQQYVINSRVISVIADKFIGPESNEVLDVHLRPLIAELERNERRVCAIRNFAGLSGHWSQEGCSLIKSRDPMMLDTCRCDRLAYFTEALTPRHLFLEVNENVLTILTVIGCVFSIFGSIVIVLTAIFFKSWRKSSRNQIWLQLSLAMFITAVCLIIVVYAKYDEYSVSCAFTGGVLHYSVLVSFCLLFVVALKALGELYSGPDSNPKRYKMFLASGFCWLVPLVLVIIFVAVESYTDPFEQKNPNSKYCRPSGTGHWLLFVTPILVLIVASWPVYFFISYKLDIGPNNRNHEISNKDRDILGYARVGLALMVFICLPPWVFDLFSNNIIAAYAFTFTATIQGFLFFVILFCYHIPTRTLWLHKLRPKST